MADEPSTAREITLDGDTYFRLPDGDWVGVFPARPTAFIEALQMIHDLRDQLRRAPLATVRCAQCGEMASTPTDQRIVNRWYEQHRCAR